MPAQPVPIERMLARTNNGKTLGGRDLEVIDTSAMVAPPALEMPEGLGERGARHQSLLAITLEITWPTPDPAPQPPPPEPPDPEPPAIAAAH